MIRTFLALELPSGLAQNLREIIKRYRRSTPLGVNWVAEQNLHLTLLFIGDVPEHLIKELDSCLGELLATQEAFMIKAEGLELFPAVQPRLLWLKLAAEGDGIFRLNRTLLKHITALGCEPDSKTLKLHVTLARIKTQFPEPMARELLATDLKTGFHSYTQLNLYRSTLSPSGPSYNIISRYNLI